MSGSQRLAGPTGLQAGGIRLAIKSGCTYNLGSPKREAVMGSQEVEGFKENPQTPFVEFEAFDKANLDVKALEAMVDTTVTVDAPNGKTIVFHNAYWAGEGTHNTDEGTLSGRFEAPRAEEV